MRICFVTPEYALHPPFGGIATQVRTMARWMATHGHDTYVICSTRDRKSCFEDDGGVGVYFVEPRRIKPRRILAYASKLPGLSDLREAYYGWDLVENSLGVWIAVRDIERRAPFDLIQCSDYGGLGFWGMWPVRRSRPIILRGHGSVSMFLQVRAWPGARFQYALERICAKRADFILSVSNYLASIYESQVSTDGKQIKVLSRIGVLPNVVARDDFLPEAVDPINRAETPVVLYVGRIERAKGCDVLLEALESVRRSVPDVRLSLIGQPTPEFEPQFRTFLQANADWATHYGHLPQNEVAVHMRRSTVLALPSRFEAAGSVLAEAQSLGLPQVATCVGGIPEYVQDGVTGLLIPPDDPELLAAAIAKLCSDPDMHMSMAQRSMELADSRDDLDANMKQFVRICEALIAGRSPSEILEAKSSSQ